MLVNRTQINAIAETDQDVDPAAAEGQAALERAADGGAADGGAADGAAADASLALRPPRSPA
jgi:hypothetical protein